MIKGKTPEEIRKTFNIKNDFTPAEEEQVSLSDPVSYVLYVYFVVVFLGEEREWVVRGEVSSKSLIYLSRLCFISLFKPYR